MQLLIRLLRNLPGLLISPVLIAVPGLALGLTSILFRVFGRSQQPENTRPSTRSASFVIPNWNGRDLLEKYLPSVLAAAGYDENNEVIVVDNGSADGSAAFVREHFPQVRLLALPQNLGFGGGSNLGIREARNDIVVLLNSDMRVDPGMLPPLLAAFDDEKVFSVTCQIFFSDPAKRREETGLTHVWWSGGMPRVRHVVEEGIQRPFPCFYGGGGSTAFDRRKFLELGGFDHLLAPFYLEDTDLGFLAWKRGWKVLYQSASHVWHEHRGTIGKNFKRAYIENTIRKNLLLFCWKNIHEPRRLAEHLLATWVGVLVSALAGDSLERANLAGLWRAFWQLPQAVSARWRALRLAVVTDTEALRRPLGGYYRDRFEPVDSNPLRLRVLFLSPYPVCPPVHGGAVFMYQTLRRLGESADLHLIALVDEPWEIEAHEELRPALRSQEFLVRLEGQPKGVGALEPFAVREFRSLDLEWLIHRQILLHGIDVFQIEYANMGQYAPSFQRLPVLLFEHDVYFQSIARQMSTLSWAGRIKASAEYLRALRYELRLLPRVDRIQTCTEENRAFLLSFLPHLDGRIDPHLRAGIDTSRYEFRPGPRRPKSMLFLGSFRHAPNGVGVRWFLRYVMPRILEQEPEATLTLIGADPPPAHTLPDYHGAVQLAGFVEDIVAPLHNHALFVCPILAGSGLRVKLLEAFACGIPVVSTRVGAEGFGGRDGEICALADDPEAFAARVVSLMRNPEEAAAMARRARDYVVVERDMAVMTKRLEASYRQALTSKVSAVSRDRASN